VREVPRVSVIIPTFNRAALLPAAVESALAAGDDLEVIVVDDASEDETPRVCAGLPRIRYLRLGRNTGVAGARNAGVLASRAEFVTALGDDDLRLPGSLDAQARLLEASPEAAFCYGRVLVADARREQSASEVMPARCPAGDIFWELLEQNFVPDLSVVARRDKLVEIGLFNPELSGAEDWDMWLRLSERWHVAAVEEPVAIYRRAHASSGQMCSDSINIYRRMLRVQKTALGRSRARAAPRGARRRACRRLLDLAYEAMVCEAEQALAEGDRVSARAKLREAFRLRPLRAATSGRLPRLLAQ
jgi:cellulose synthase/poly-beta-1,6-N-acetylglucosamine synthase-like glycosyltransferase